MQQDWYKHFIIINVFNIFIVLNIYNIKFTVLTIFNCTDRSFFFIKLNLLHKVSLIICYSPGMF